MLLRSPDQALFLTAFSRIDELLTVINTSRNDEQNAIPGIAKIIEDSYARYIHPFHVARGSIGN